MQRMGLNPFTVFAFALLLTHVCIDTDTKLNFDGDTDVKCEQAFRNETVTI